MTHDAPPPVYGSAVTKVEPFGVDHIPDSERHGKPSSQFFVWFAAGLNFPIILLGFSAARFGLSFGAAVTAIVAGAGLGSVLMAVMSRMGVRLGVPQQIQARGPLGFYGSGGTFGADPGADGYVGATGGWVTFGGWFLSFLVAWVPFASDYSRYLPDTDHVVRRTAWYTGLGDFVTICWLGILGVLVGSSSTSTDSITALHQLAGPFAVPALIAIALSALAQNFLNVYGGAISVQTLKVPVSRTQAVTIICALAYGISLWGETGTEEKFKVFLNLTANFIAPFAAVVLLDYVLGGRADPARIAELYDRNRILDWGIVVWVAGVLASVPFWQSSAFTGPFAAAYPGAGDLSMFVAAGTAVVLYLLTYRLKPLWTRTPGTGSPPDAHAAEREPAATGPTG
ncbi:cytosine permease [Streptomyces sp. NPDC088124]|uniref:purine-cytosine permease family protein n=1 Tax=Streptomyces sp. NPDC088124 TaxID=3154654 RepID=UPI0034407402